MSPEPNRTPQFNLFSSPSTPTVSTLETELTSEVGDGSPLAFLWLIIGLLALSSTAIFIKLSVHEISAEATVFNRLWIATLAFASMNWLGLAPSRHQDSGHEVRQDAETTAVDLPSCDECSTESVSTLSRRSSEVVSNPAKLQSAFADISRLVQSWPWSSIGLLLALGLVHLTGRYLWTWSLTKTTAANGAMLSNMPPLFTALGGWLFLGQRFDRRFLTGLAIAVIGSVVLVIGDWIQPKEALFGSAALVGDAAALVSSVFYAASFLLVEKLRQHLSTPNILV